MLLFRKKYDDPEEEMEDNTRLVGRSFVCAHLKLVKIKCSEYETRVHLLAELFKANDVPVEKIYVRQQITCESYILFILLSVRHFQCQAVLLLLYVAWQCYSVYLKFFFMHTWGQWTRVFLHLHQATTSNHGSMKHWSQMEVAMLELLFWMCTCHVM